MAASVDMIVFVFLIQLLAFTVKGMLGFGNPLIAGSLLSFRLDNIVISPGTLLIDLPVNAYITWQNRRSFQWRRIAPLIAANLLGVIPGVFLLRFSLPWVLKTILGGIVVILGVDLAVSKEGTASGKDRPALRLMTAFLSGTCSGVFGINMFLAAYLKRTARDYSEFKGSLGFLFFCESIFRTSMYIAGGMFTADVLRFSLASAPAALLAMLLAARLGHRVDEQKLQKAAIVIFIAGGISIIIKSVVFHT